MVDYQRAQDTSSLSAPRWAADDSLYLQLQGIRHPLALEASAWNPYKHTHIPDKNKF